MSALMVLMTVHGQNGAPSLAEAARELGVSVADVDDKFGVVPIDPEKKLYAVQVKESSVAGSKAGSGEEYRGPFSNPRIAPFGPIQSEAKPDEDER